MEEKDAAAHLLQRMKPRFKMITRAYRRSMMRENLETPAAPACAVRRETLISHAALGGCGLVENFVAMRPGAKCREISTLCAFPRGDAASRNFIGATRGEITVVKNEKGVSTGCVRISKKFQALFSVGSHALKEILVAFARGRQWSKEISRASSGGEWSLKEISRHCAPGLAPFPKM